MSSPEHPEEKMRRFMEGDPVRRPVDDALDRLAEIERWHRNGADFCSHTDEIARHEGYADTIATVREALDARMTRESGQALIDDANRWERAYRHARHELARLREERDDLRDEYMADAGLRTAAEARERNTFDRLEEALAENRRLTEGLREIEGGFNDISLILEAENDGYQERAYKRAVEEWRHVRALLSASPSDGGGV